MGPGTRNNGIGSSASYNGNIPPRKNQYKYCVLPEIDILQQLSIFLRDFFCLTLQIMTNDLSAILVKFQTLNVPEICFPKIRTLR